MSMGLLLRRIMQVLAAVALVGLVVAFAIAGHKAVHDMREQAHLPPPPPLVLHNCTLSAKNVAGGGYYDPSDHDMVSTSCGTKRVDDDSVYSTMVINHVYDMTMYGDDSVRSVRDVTPASRH